MRFLTLLLCFLGISLGPGTLSLSAQSATTTGDNQIEILFNRLFASGPPFIAQMETVLTSKGDTITNRVMLAADKGKIRKVVNVAAIGAEPMSPDVVNTLKEFGVDFIVTIYRLDRRQKIILLPRAQGYAIETWQMPKITDSTGTPIPGTFKTEKLEPEQMEGHACIKELWTVSDGANDLKVTVWRATEINNLIIRWQLKETDTLATVTLRDIKTDKIDFKLFETPSNYRRFPNRSALIRYAATLRMHSKRK